MRIRNSIYYTAILTLFVAEPMLGAESISQIQSLQGQVWVDRGDEKIGANSASEIYSGDLISTSESGRLGTRLWSQLNLKLDPSSKIMIVSGANKDGKDASVAQKMIKLEYGAGCIEIDHLMDSTVFFQIGERVTIKFTKPVELCLSTDLVKSHIQLIRGSAKLMHLTNSMVIALNEPGSEINFFNGGIFSLLSPSSASPQVIPTEDPKEFAKSEDLKESPKTVDLKVPSKIEAPIALSKTEGLKESSKTADLKVPSKTEAPIALAKIETPIALSKTEDSDKSSKTVDLKVPSKTEVPIALAKIEAPIALSKTEGPNISSKTENSKELYNVNLNSSRSYEATAAVNRRLRDSGYGSVVIDEIDDKGPLFRVSVPNFETITAARGFVDKVVASLGIHDAWIERHVTERSKTEERKASAKKEETKERKASANTDGPKELSKKEDLKELSKSVDLKEPSKTEVPIVLAKIEAPVALSKTEDSNEPSMAVDPNESSKIKNPKELYNVNLNSSRSYEATAAVNRRLRDSGYGSVVIDEIDNKGPLFRVSVPNFETITAARGFVDKVVVNLGIHDAWIERHLIERSKTEERKASAKKEETKVPSKTEAPIAVSKTEDLKVPSKTVAPIALAKIEAPIALSKTEVSNEPSKAVDTNESSKTKNPKELYNVNLNSSRSYEATAAVNRRLRDSGYGSVVIDEIDNKGPLFRVSVPNFETITAARGFVDKVVVNLGIHDAWIERQRSKK